MAGDIEQSPLKHNYFVLKSLVMRDFKLKYRRSILGVVWSVLNPLLMMTVLTAVFSFMFRFSIENYPLYLILGNILFALVSDSTTEAMHSIIANSSLIKKIKIEKSIFPVEKVLFQLVNFTFSLIAVACVMIFFKIAPTANLLFLPLLLLYVVLFSIGLGMVLSSLAVFFRDVIHLWGVIMTAWMYATPIFYPIEQLDGWMQQVMNFNPLYHYVTYFRDIVMWNTTPSLSQNLICLCMALFSFLIGVAVFKKCENRFILYV